MHRVQTTRQTRRLPILALTARIPTVRKEKIRRMQQPLLIAPHRHNKESMLEGRGTGPLYLHFYGNDGFLYEIKNTE